MSPEFVKLLLNFRQVVLRGYEKESQVILARCLHISVSIFHSYTLSDISKVGLTLFLTNSVHKDHLILKHEFFEKLRTTV